MFGSACVETQSKDTESSSVLQESQTSPTPVQTPSKLKIEKFDINKAEKISFSKLPREIIKYLAQYENRAEYTDKNGELQSYPADSPKWYEGRFVKVLSKDLNNDGVPEKIVICDDSAEYDVEPTAYLFILKDSQWVNLHSGGFGSPGKLELLSTANTSEFDIIGYGGERKDVDGKTIKFTGYWRVEDGQYKRFECRETKESVEKTVPCQK